MSPHASGGIFFGRTVYPHAMRTTDGKKEKSKSPARRWWRIGLRVASIPLLLVYIAVALCNYSVIQSYLGTAASRYFSREWGGKVKIASLHATPLGHVKLKGVELIAPTGDTIFAGERVDCHFKHFPVNGDGLEFSKVSITNAYYHLGFNGEKINLRYIIDYFKSTKPREKRTTPFVVRVNRLLLHNLHYKQDLKRQSAAYANAIHSVNVSHMDFPRIDANIKDVRVERDNVDCRIVKFYAEERSGFRLKDLSGDIKVSHYLISAQNMELTTDHTHLLCDAALKFDGWKSMKRYCENVDQTVTIREGSYVGMTDAGYWAPMLWGMDERVEISGNVYGPIADMFVDSLHIAFGKGSSLALDGHIEGLPHIKQTTVKANLHQLKTNYSDLAAVKHPAGIEMKFPQVVRSLDTIDLTAIVDGSFDRCQALVEVQSKVGDLSVSAATATDPGTGRRSYNGTITSKSIEVATLLGKKKFIVEQSGIDMAFSGEGTRLKDLVLSLDGSLTGTVISGRNLRSSTLSARIDHQTVTASIGIDDTLAKLTANGRAHLGADKNDYEAELDIRQCDLSQVAGIHLRGTERLEVSTHASAHLSGKKLDDIEGTLVLQNTEIGSGDMRKVIDRIALSTDTENGFRKVGLKSELLDCDLSGYFDYADIPLAVKDFEIRHLGWLFDGDDREELPESGLALSTFDFDMTWNDPNHVIELLAPKLSIAEGTHIEGTYNYYETIGLRMQSDSVALGTIGLKRIEIEGRSTGDQYLLSITSDSLGAGKNGLLKNLEIALGLHDEDASCHIVWDDHSAKIANEGDIGLLMSMKDDQIHIGITDPVFFVNGNRWELDCDDIRIAQNGIDVEQLSAATDGQYINADIHMTHTPEDYATMTFHNFSIDRLDSLLFSTSKIAIEGQLNGKVMASGFDGTPYANADISIRDCYFNGQPLGTLKVMSDLDVEKQRLNLNATSKLAHGNVKIMPLAAEGHIDLKSAEMEIEAHIEQFELETIAPFLSSFASQFQGQLNSDIAISGTFKHPRIKGSASFAKSLMHIDPTGVTYHFNDSIVFSDSKIYFNQFRITDPLDNVLSANGNIDFDKEGKLNINLDIEADKLMLMKLPASDELPSGTMFASIGGAIKGPIDDLSIDLKAKTKGGSSITIPINNKKETSDQEYIHFVQSSAIVAQQRELMRNDTTLLRRPRTTARMRQNKQAKFKLRLDLNVTPDVMLHIPMDFSRLTSAITASGKGDLQLHYENGKSPTIVGTYEFSNGNMSINFLSLFEKTFTIDPGSTLLLPGDIQKTRFDLRAIYAQRANLSTLNDEVSENSQRNITVENVIALTGTIDDPSIDFDIRLPNADQMSSEMVFTYIDRTNQQEMINQTISLLLLGQFHNSNSTASNNQMLTNAASGGYNLMANSLSSVVSNMIKVVNVNFGYKAATEVTNQQFDVDISKEWEQFYFETTIGYGGTTRNVANNDNYLVGDVLLGYKLSPTLHLFGFNRTNTNDFTRIELPYKQGIGMKYTRDFNKWRELFKKEKPLKQQ